MIAAWGLVALWMAAVAVVSIAPIAAPDVEVPIGADKWAHAAFYAVLGWLAARAARRSGASPATAWGSAVALAALYGAGVEGVQSAVGRDASLGDWMADAIGAVAGAAIVAVRGEAKPIEEGR
ncbi:MAG: VanZ family protein [Gemmatimonadetes bacterium]|nr:VanZ family protein [Gemmatimonadota bacterium]